MSVPVFSNSLGIPSVEIFPAVATENYYTEAMAVDHLGHPAGSTDGRVFDVIADLPGIRGSLEFKSRWGLLPLIEVRVPLTYPPIRKAYEGPTYFQGYNAPTCEAWATVHALLAAKADPSVSLVKNLLNAAQIGENGRQGLDFITTEGIIRQRTRDIDFNVSGQTGIKPTVEQLASYIKAAIDAEGAALAVIEIRRPGNPLAAHTVCISGYSIDNQGRMDVQIIDSACGAGAVSIENLREKLDINKITPLATVTKQTSIGSTLGWTAFLSNPGATSWFS